MVQGQVFTPKVGDIVDATTESHIFQVYLSLVPILCQNFLISYYKFKGFFFKSWGRKKKKKKILKMTFSELFFFFLISPEKTVKLVR